MDSGQRLVCRASGRRNGGRGRRRDRSEKSCCASLTSSDLASLKILLAGQREPVRRGVPFRDHSPKSPASSPLMPLSRHRLVAVAVLSPKYPVGSSSRPLVRQAAGSSARRRRTLREVPGEVAFPLPAMTAAATVCRPRLALCRASTAGN